MASLGKDPPSPVTEPEKMEDSPLEDACGLQSLDTLPSPSSDHDDLLVCGICEELYDDDTHKPKFLSCFHTFCAHCLDKLSNKKQSNPASIQCPNCRSNTQLPASGVYGLQTNFYIARMKNVSKHPEQPKTHQTRTVAFKPCYRHTNQTKSYFCVTCEITLCRDCIVTDHTAATGHSVISISEEESVYVQELNDSQKTLALNKRNHQIIESELALLTAAKETALKDVETFIMLANNELGQHKTVLTNQILQQFNTQKNYLLDKQRQIQTETEMLNKNITQAKTMTKTGDLRKLMPISESLKRDNEKIISVFSKMDLGKNFLAVDFDNAIDEFKKSLAPLGEVCFKGHLPTKIQFVSTEATAGLKATLTATLYDHHGDKMAVSAGSLSVQITDLVGTELLTHLEMNDTQCTVTFKPQMSGLHQVLATFMGQKLVSDQTHFSVKSNNPVLKFGGNGNGKGTFNFPWAIAIDNNNCLYVADTQNHLIQKFTADGKFLSQFSVAVHNKDHTTCDIILDLDKGWIVCPEISIGKVFGAENNILVFDFEGKLLHTYALKDASFSFNIAINRNGDIITSDIHKKTLYKVDGSSTFLCQMKGINRPGYISINDDDSIIVPDRAKGCIYILNPDGTVRHRIGSSGTGKGQLKGPYGIASDGEYILVTEEKNNRLQVFTYDGTFVSVIGNGEDPLLEPSGMAVTTDGHVYVVDTGHHCVKKYKYKDVAWWQGAA